MNIQFDTTSTNETETRALIAFLSALLPTPNGQAHQVSAPAPTTLIEQLKGSLALAEAPTTPGPVLVESATPAAEPAKRTRRTKEQMAADEAAAAQISAVKQAASPTPALTPTETLAQVVNGVAKTVSADELRALLNGYIARHSMEDAIDKLKLFKCNRVTEALALESDKLNELAAVLNG